MSVKLTYLLVTFCLFVANAITVSSLDLLGPYILDPGYAELNSALDKDSVVDFVSLILPFPFVFLLIFLHAIPVIRSSGPAHLLPDRIRRRIINSPLHLSIFGSSGWLLGYILFQIIAYVRGYRLPLGYLLQNSIQFLVLLAITFVVGYYLIEFLIRRYAIPRIVPDGKISEIGGVRHITIRGRMLILYLAVVLIPVLVLYRVLIVLNAGGDNIHGKDISTALNIMAFVLLLVGFLITMLKAGSLNDPILDMQQISSRIAQKDYEARVHVVSTDEIGNLGERMNEMAEGLAERERIRDVFGKVVDPGVRDLLISGELKLGGERKQATVLFTDLQGFTALSESRDPEEVVGLLNDYFRDMTQCIRAHGGMVNKFIGDAIMAVFGAPIPSNDHAGQAVAAAAEMLALDSRYHGVTLTTRIGIHTGSLLAGNIGSDERMEYTVMGDTVNTASRLESACKNLKLKLLVSESTVQRLPANLREDLGLKPVAKVRLKGKKEPVSVFTVSPSVAQETSQ
ncbi:MAG: HAMP domain-containing protein [Leptospiraceae bacterium]|nr:HAMP domain-containing protein [Leptospiraceae bacterium]